MINSFLEIGVPVTGDNFIGRDNLLRIVKEHLLARAQVSIAGLGRVGKSSLAREVLRQISELPNISTARVEINQFRDEGELWKEILFAFFDDFDETTYPGDNDDAYRWFRRCLRSKKKAGFQGVLLLDEFDSVREYGNAKLIIDRIREIACDRATYGLTFLFVSRRSLKRIQEECSGSNLFGICQKYYLGSFDQEEISKLSERHGMKIPADALARVFYYTGGYPYLTQHLLKELNEELRKSVLLTEGSVDLSFERCKHEFMSIFESFKEFLSYDDEWNSFCREFIPPKTEKCLPEIIQHLKDYGLITDGTDSNCISDYFCELIQCHYNNLPLLEPLRDLEKRLRHIVAQVLQQKYGNNWPIEIREKSDWYRRTFAQLDELRIREQKKFHAETSIFDIMEYSYPGTLKDIILQEWDSFKYLFGNDKALFAKSMNAICSIRTPFAHFRRAELVPQSSINQAMVAIQTLDKFLNAPTD